MQRRACSCRHPRSSSSRPTFSCCSSSSSSARSRRRQLVRCAAGRAARQQPGGGGGDGAVVTLFYRSAWPAAKLHGSLNGGAWSDFPLERVTSAPGKWLRARIPAPRGRLEFVVTDGADGWDKPAAGGNYTIDGPGAYTLRHGQVARLPADGPPPVLLVTDLDGTMVGADDNATGAFRAWWENEAVLRGGLLAFNTGRALPSVEQLLADKAGCLAHPDVVISAVGTKVYNFTPAGAWEEDVAWRRQLDEGWSGEAVREAAYAALAQVGKDAMHFRPPEEQNAHKVTCGVATAVLPRVTDAIAGRLAAEGVSASVVTSGVGDWRFLDLVPARAGKLQALEHVRTSHGFGHAATVACGDSGNDISMLGGDGLAIVVGNAQPDLLAWVEQQQQQEQDGPLPGKARLLVARQHEAAGILEGLDYYGLL